MQSISLSMSYSNNSRSKTNEGCGKWLTTKGKSNPKSCVTVKPNKTQNLRKKPKLCLTETNSHITRLNLPPISPHIEDKLSNMKQTKINKFLITKPSQCSSSIKHSSKTKNPISFTMKRGMAVDLNEYDDLWGSESEDENSEILLNSQMPSKISFSPPIAKTSLPTTSCNTAKNMSLEIRINSDKKDDKEQDKVFSSPKSFIKANDPVSSSDTSLTSQFYTSRNEFPFTQWFQDQVDKFCNCSSEIKKSDLMKDILSSAPCGYHPSPKSEQSRVLSFKQESSLMIQFSQWFNQQIKALSSQSSSSEDNGSQENWTDFPNKISKESFAFTQWFEENLEKYLKS